MSMTLTIPDVDEAVERKLRALAASHGRTLQAEAREILARTVEGFPASDVNPVLTMSARDAVRGLWTNSMSTDELMNLTRGDESDDAYSRR